MLRWTMPLFIYALWDWEKRINAPIVYNWNQEISTVLLVIICRFVYNLFKIRRNKINIDIFIINDVFIYIV